MKVLVTGGTGTVGSQVVRKLMSRRVGIQVLSRDPARHVYAYFQKSGLKASSEAIVRLTAILGRAPRSFEAFATETAAAWLGRGSPPAGAR